MFDFACNGLGYGSSFGSGIFFTALIWLLIVGLGVWLITWLVTRNRHAASTNAGSISLPANDTAVEILKQRYARGEISKAEYETMRDALPN
jgi:putative membrane protein